MRRSIIYLAIAAITAALFGCAKDNDKNNLPNNTDGEPVSLQVSLAGTQTKTIFDYHNGEGFKVTWDANEEISLLSYNSMGYLQSVDNLTSTGAAGRSEATFKGTYSKMTTAKYWVVIYPALTAVQKKHFIYGEKSNGKGTQSSIVFNSGTKYITGNYTYNSFQSSSNDYSHLSSRDLMSAWIGTEPTDGTIGNIKLTKHNAILRFDLDASDLKGEKISKFTVKYNPVTSTQKLFGCGRGLADFGWGKEGNGPDKNLFAESNENSANVYFGDTETPFITVPSNGELKVYIPFTPAENPSILSNDGSFELELSNDEYVVSTKTITFTNDISIKAGCVYTFKTTMPKPAVAPTSIALDKASVELRINKTIQLNATILPSNASNKEVIWSVDNSDVATVDNNGKVTAKGAGEATVTATSAADNTLKATCKINVISQVSFLWQTNSSGVNIYKDNEVYAEGYEPVTDKNGNIYYITFSSFNIKIYRNKELFATTDYCSIATEHFFANNNNAAGFATTDKDGNLFIRRANSDGTVDKASISITDLQVVNTKRACMTDNGDIYVAGFVEGKATDNKQKGIIFIFPKGGEPSYKIADYAEEFTNIIAVGNNVYLAGITKNNKGVSIYEYGYDIPKYVFDIKARAISTRVAMAADNSGQIWTLVPYVGDDSKYHLKAFIRDNMFFEKVSSTDANEVCPVVNYMFVSSAYDVYYALRNSKIYKNGEVIYTLEATDKIRAFAALEE